MRKLSTTKMLLLASALGAAGYLSVDPDQERPEKPKRDERPPGPSQEQRRRLRQQERLEAKRARRKALEGGGG